MQDKIVRGQIDLVFRNNDSDSETDEYTIVDYKTDSSIKPEEHYEQIALYRQAISQMLNCPVQNIKCYLYYLRFNKAVNISNEINSLETISDEM